MSSFTYSVFGLQVSSTVELPLRAARSARSADVSVFWAQAPRAVPDCPAEGTVIASLDRPEGGGYALTKADQGYVLRFYGHCDFLLTRELDRIQARPSAECSSELAALFLIGPVLSTLLTLKGRCVVHASAVSLAGHQLAFIGPSNHGKSTLAAALCNAGAALIADDALCCDVHDEAVICYPSAEHIRLREGAKALAYPEAQEGGRTVDGRLALKVPISVDGPLPLHALVAPRLTADDTIAVRRLAGAEALCELTRSTRVTGWREPKLGRLQFEGLASIGRKVPVFALTMPRGAVFSEPGLQRILDALLPILDAKSR